jgi:hypothetical protein
LFDGGPILFLKKIMTLKGLLSLDRLSRTKDWSLTEAVSEERFSGEE